MTAVQAYSVSGAPDGSVELPPVFATPVRPDLIKKAYINLESHRFQPKGTHPTAGMDVVARSNDPPTGRGTSRIAKMRGGGGGRQGQAGGVASVRGGRQAHPPKVQKVIHKKINRKENRLALCSAIAATASRDLVESRGHRVGADTQFPIIVSDEIESVAKTQDLAKIVGSLNLGGDIDRLRRRKARTGKSALRGRGKKIGKSILFVTRSPPAAADDVPGDDVPGVTPDAVPDTASGVTPDAVPDAAPGDTTPDAAPGDATDAAPDADPSTSPTSPQTPPPKPAPARPSRRSTPLSRAAGALPGVEVRTAGDLSVLDLAPGSTLIRLTVYSRGAIEELAGIRSPHLDLMVAVR